MIPLIRRLVDSLLHDELAVRRWTRAAVMGLAFGGVAYADKLAEVLGDGAYVDWLKTASAVAALASVAITAGERNPRLERDVARTIPAGEVGP